MTFIYINDTNKLDEGNLVVVEGLDCFEGSSGKCFTYRQIQLYWPGTLGEVRKTVLNSFGTATISYIVIIEVRVFLYFIIQ